MNWKSFIVAPLLISAACGVPNTQSATPKHTEYTAPAHTATSAVMTLGSSPESITVNPLASGADNYFDAKIDYIGTMTYNAAGANDSYTITLTENANNLSYSGSPLKWDIGIDPSTPLDLTVSSSSGGLTLNLNDFTISALDASTSSGSIEVYLPALDQQYVAALSTSSGSMTATVADNAQVNFAAVRSSSGSVTLNSGTASKVSANVNTSSGAIALNFSADAEANVNISTSSGAVTTDVPDGAALRLEIASNSSGAVNVPGWMQQISGDNKTGVWETADFNQAAHQIFITVTNDSSGDISIQ